MSHFMEKPDKKREVNFMSILGFLAWGVYGALAIDDARQNKKYTNHSYQLAVKEGRDFYHDQRGRTYYVPTGEEIVITRMKRKSRFT